MFENDEIEMTRGPGAPLALVHSNLSIAVVHEASTETLKAVVMLKLPMPDTADIALMPMVQFAEEHLPATVFDDWGEVLAVMGGMMRCGLEAYGPPPKGSFEHLMRVFNRCVP